MLSENRTRLRAALVGAVLLSALTLLGLHALSREGRRPLLLAEVQTGSALDGASRVSLSAAHPALPQPLPPEAAALAPPRPLLREHDDLSQGAARRHLLRATIAGRVEGDELRRCLDMLIDEERMLHPEVDAVALYLYEEGVYERYTGRITPLQVALAHAVWAPGGDLRSAPRSISGLDNRTVYSFNVAAGKEGPEGKSEREPN